MEVNKRKRWKERVSRLATMEVNNEEKEQDWEEEEGEDCEEKEVSQNEEEEEMEMSEEGENVGRGVEEIKKGDTEDREMVEEDERLDVEKEEEEEEYEVDREVEEKEEGDTDEKKEVKNTEELEERDEEWEGEEERKVKKNKKGDEEDNSNIKEAEEMEEMQEDEENEGERKVMENKGVGTEEEEAEEVEDEEKEVEDEVEKVVNLNGELWGVEAERMEEKQEEGEHEFEKKVKMNEKVDEVEDRHVRDKEQVEEQEEHQGQEQIGQHHLVEQFRGQMSRTKEQNQESTRREDKTVNEEEDSDNEDSDFMESENESNNFEELINEERAVEKLEELEDLDVKSCRNESSILGMGTSKEGKDKDDKSEKLGDEVETVANSWTAQEEVFEDDQKMLEEEETTDDEEAEHSAEQDVENHDEDVVKIYCKDDYLTDLFGNLTEFRDSSVLTDLTLSTDDGFSFNVHSIVLAAVSSFIWESLNRNKKENDEVDKINDDDTSVPVVQRWSVCLGPEVDQVGLKAVAEFAYTGLISCFSKDIVHKIRAAAQTLGAPRVLDLCKDDEEKSAKTTGQKKEERMSASEQMMITLKSIKQMWMDRVGCDVILEALGGWLHVHRVILAVCSDYFRSMFTLGMRESRQPCVTLPILLASELEVLIGCSYSGALPLSWSCVFDITSTALQLQYQPALSLCLNFFQQEMNPHFCLDVASFAGAYEMMQLLEVADDFVLRQFQKVSCTPKFKDLPAKQLLRYLTSHSLCVPSELVVFKAVVAWIQAKPKRRLKLAEVLMKTIHFPLMTFKEFKEVQSLNMWSDNSLAELYKAVFEDFCSNEIAPQSQCRIYLPKESLVLIGGDHTSEDMGSRNISRELWFGNSLRNHTGIKKAMEWRMLGEMPDPARFTHEVTVLKGQLYVFGGKKYYGINDTLNSVYRYDPLQNSWEVLAGMQEMRSSFSVVVLDGQIYAIGGHNDCDLESVERYCPTANSWSFTWPLDLPLSAHVAKVLRGHIFVSGGLNSDYQCLASMFLYHPETGSTYLANMAKPRAHHCMETLGEFLYVAGGVTTDANMSMIDHLACEVYSPMADSWTAFTSLPVPHVGAGSAVLEEKFYVLGGYSHEDYSDTKIVHRFDPTTWRWENMGRMPGPNNDIRAALLCLPPHFRL